MKLNKNNSLVIIGAGGHGRVIADIAAKIGYYDKIIFLDDSTNTKVKTVGKIHHYKRYITDHDFIVAIGNNEIRRNIFDMLINHGAFVTTLIHPNAVISSDVLIGKGTVVMPGAVINVGAKIGECAIINTCSSIDHDCIIGDFTHVSVGAHLAGSVDIGCMSMIGAGATIINNIYICNECIIGAGAVVIRNIYTPGIYTGIPAKLLQ